MKGRRLRMNKIKDFIKNTILYKPLASIKSGFIQVFSPFGYIRNYILFPITGFLRVHHFPLVNSNYKFIDEIRGKHQGERCFIIATGPSLKMEDVEKLKDEVTIGVNSFYRVYDKTDFRPTYYVALDPDVQNSLLNNYRGEPNDLAKEKVFMNSIVKERISGVDYLPYCYQNHWFNLFNEKNDYSKNLKYTDDLLYGIYDKYTVTNAAIDLAIHFGCREIYLIGVDCNYSGPTQYFVKPTVDTFTPDEMQAFLQQKAMMVGYRFMEKETKKRGIKIYNATRGGMLEEFERVDFDEVLNK